MLFLSSHHFCTRTRLAREPPASSDHPPACSPPVQGSNTHHCSWLLCVCVLFQCGLWGSLSGSHLHGGYLLSHLPSPRFTFDFLNSLVPHLFFPRKAFRSLLSPLRCLQSSTPQTCISTAPRGCETVIFSYSAILVY